MKQKYCCRLHFDPSCCCYGYQHGVSPTLCCPFSSPLPYPILFALLILFISSYHSQRFPLSASLHLIMYLGYHAPPLNEPHPDMQARGTHRPMVHVKSEPDSDGKWEMRILIGWQWVGDLQPKSNCEIVILKVKRYLHHPVMLMNLKWLTLQSEKYLSPAQGQTRKLFFLQWKKPCYVSSANFWVALRCVLFKVWGPYNVKNSVRLSVSETF